MRSAFKVFIVGLVFAVMAGCGSGGSGSGSSGVSPIAPAPIPSAPSISIAGGNDQTALIGSPLPEPVQVVVTDASGYPISGRQVSFSVASGSGILSITNAWTGADGKASVNTSLGGLLKPLKVSATCDGIGSVTITANPRLPTLGEVLGATNQGEPVAQYPALLTTLDTGEIAIVLLTGQSRLIDIDDMPTAAELAGGTIQGAPAEDYPVVFLPVDALTSSTSTVFDPMGSQVAAGYVASDTASNLPVVTNLLVNGDPAAVAILGDATGIASDTLGDLIAADAIVDGIPVANLPVYLVDSADFPSDPDLDEYSYFARVKISMPVFDFNEPVTGAAAGWIGYSSTILTTTSPSLVTLTGGEAARGLVLYQTPPLIEVAAPEASLFPLPVKFIGVFNVIQDEIVPLIEAGVPAQDKIRDDLQQLGQILQDNQDLIDGLMNGGEVDPLQLLPLAQQLMPLIDDIIQNNLLLLDNLELQLFVIENDLLPAISDALPPDGIVFGGFSDGDPSSVRDDVIPYLQGQIDILQEALTDLRSLLEDLDALIPADGNVLTLAANLSSIMPLIQSDINALMGHLADGIQHFDDVGMPILYDALEQAEHDNPAGSSPISALPAFAEFVAALQAAYPPDTTLGDLPGFDQLAPILAKMLPLGTPDPADISLFDTIIPAIGSVDIGEDILPILRAGLDSLDAALPDIIAQIRNFDATDFNFDFGL